MEIESLFLQLKEFDIKTNRTLIENVIHKNVKYFIIIFKIDKSFCYIHFKQFRKLKFR
jgi:hypothetical protein